MANGDPGGGHSKVAIILAIGIATAVNFIVIAVLYDAIFSEGPGLSDNATQVITGAFGGIIGVLGSYIGYRAGAASQTPEPPPLVPPPGVERPAAPNE